MKEEKQIEQEPVKPIETGITLSKPKIVGLIISSLVGAAVVAYIVVYSILGRTIDINLPLYPDADDESVIDIIDNSIPEEDEAEEEVLVLHTSSFFSMFVEGDNMAFRDYTPSLRDQDLEIDWYKGAKPASIEEKEKTLDKTLDIILQDPKDAAYLNREDFSLYVAGTVAAPSDLEGEPLYIIIVRNEGMGTYYNPTYAIYDEEKQQFIRIVSNKEEQSYYSEDKIYAGFVVKEFEELIPPKVIDIPGEDSQLKYQTFLSKVIGGMFLSSPGTQGNVGGILDVEAGEIETMYDNNDIAFNHPIYGPVYLIDDCFRVVMPDGAVHIYDLLPYFFNTDSTEGEEKEMYQLGYTVNIDWENERNEEDIYELSGMIQASGCGRGVSICTNIINDQEWFFSEELKEIGKTASKGEPVYELYEKNGNPYYRDLYEFGYAGAKTIGDPGEYIEFTKRMAEDDLDEMYTDYSQDEPLFVWKDHMDNWRVYKKTKYRPMAECAKPVIYLYPEEDLDVHVQVDPQGGFKYTDPDYGEDGWYVRTDPMSNIYNYSNKQNYPYLFWEGYEYNFRTPEYGFVMSREEVPAKMQEILEKVGLNKKESADFMEFWEEKLVVELYVFVTFLPQQEFDKIAPLSVEPAPDKIIRVFMDYVPLKRPIKVTEPKIKTPQREGFTVVEWGGRLK